jgi:hypothetical protein
VEKSSLKNCLLEGEEQNTERITETQMRDDEKLVHSSAIRFWN